MSKQLTEQEFRSIVREEIHRLFEDDIGFENLPPGWDRDSLMSFARSLTDKTKSDPEGFFTACMEEMEDKFDEPERFCASLKDEYLQTTDWRGESRERSGNRISEGADSQYVQDTIEVIVDDWSRELSDDEKEALNFLKTRLNQTLPSGDVARSDLKDIMKSYVRRRNTSLRISKLMDLVDIILDA